MKILFTTDFHLGLTRTENTTAASAERLQAEIYRRAIEASASDADLKFNLGDLFHKHSNPERIVLQGLAVAGEYDMVLAGNHDVLNVKDSVSSLDLVSEVRHGDQSSSWINTPVVLSPNPSEPYYWNQGVDDHPHSVQFCAVPHCFTQELFVQSVEAACAEVDKWSGPRKILMLHCNVGDGFSSLDDASASLWLTAKLQKKVATAFDLIMIGHEHDPRRFKPVKDGGEIVIMGNLFPVSFGEISDRFVYELETDTMTLTPVKIFDAKENWAVVDANDLIGLDGKWPMTEPFIDIEGEVDAEDMGKLSRALGQLWKINEATALMIRNGAKVTRATLADEKQAAIEQLTLPERVKLQAADAGFTEELNELIKEITHG